MEAQRSNTQPGAQVRIAKIRDIEWYTADISELLDQKIDIRKGMSMGILGTHRIIESEKMFVLRLQLLYKRPTDSEILEDMLRYTVETQFYIANFFDILPKHEDGDGSYKLPSYLMEMFVSITLSTMRGIVVEKTANSYFRDIYLPILDPKDIINQIFE